MLNDIRNLLFVFFLFLFLQLWALVFLLALSSEFPPLRRQFQSINLAPPLPRMECPFPDSSWESLGLRRTDISCTKYCSQRDGMLSLARLGRAPGPGALGWG